jgi:4'-phosphopantetheinyl transferase
VTLKVPVYGCLHRAGTRDRPAKDAPATHAQIARYAGCSRKGETSRLLPPMSPRVAGKRRPMTAPLLWAATPRDMPLTLPTSRVDCWAVSLADRPADAGGISHSGLAAEEIERAERFFIERDRASYISRHVALRLLVARYLKASPEAVAFAQEKHGRPVLANPAGCLHFNLSHAGDLALIAVSCVAPLGVDVEQVRNIEDFAEIARDNFARAEFEDLQGVAPENRLRAFFVTWTRKEAFVKALGVGLSYPLDAFSSGRPDRPPRLCIGDTLATDWTLVDLLPRDGYAGALAIRHPNAPICCRRAEWPWLFQPMHNPADR